MLFGTVSEVGREWVHYMGIHVRQGEATVWGFVVAIASGE